MSSRVIKPVSTKTNKNQKESINKIATMVDLLNLNGIMIKHKSQEVYLKKNYQKEKSNSRYILNEKINKQVNKIFLKKIKKQKILYLLNLCHHIIKKQK